MAFLSVLTFYNFGHPQFYDTAERKPTYVHTFDMRVYFPAVKYFDELGYTGFYQCLMAADADEILAAGNIFLVLVRGFLPLVGEAVEPGQPHGAAHQVNEGDHPAEAVVESAEDDVHHQQGRRYSEGHDVRQRIELASEIALGVSQPRDTTVEGIQKTGDHQQNRGLLSLLLFALDSFV